MEAWLIVVIVVAIALVIGIAMWAAGRGMQRRVEREHEEARQGPAPFGPADLGYRA